MSEEAPQSTSKAGRRRNRRFFVFLVGVCLCGCGGLIAVPLVLLPLMIQARVSVRKVDCITNLKESTGAVLLYSVDFDHQIPPTNRWVEATMPFARSLGSYRCPAVTSSSYGFAVNDFLSGRPLPQTGRAKTVLLFEPQKPQMNAHGYPKADSASPPRHGGRNNFSLVDGSARPMAKLP